MFQLYTIKFQTHQSNQKIETSQRFPLFSQKPRKLRDRKETTMEDVLSFFLLLTVTLFFIHLIKSPNGFLYKTPNSNWVSIKIHQHQHHQKQSWSGQKRTHW
ncbi:hypothetical protein L6452_12882 [Arctium lappa]|uniref:Uncharacterized protein n=1 Tax=Arctium lappa TaxID=4217 RepID=A0ACB9CGM4_ARCLA|nr:hypothetical protein L6452_12882 [Arctium lappa]